MSFSFPWWETDLTGGSSTETTKRREAMYAREIEERAALFHRMGFTREDAKQRLRANLSWDFEQHANPKLLSKVDSMVEQIWKRGGRLRGGPPSLD